MLHRLRLGIAVLVASASATPAGYSSAKARLRRERTLGFSRAPVYWSSVSADYLHLLQAAAVGRTCVIERREHDWAFDFGDGVGMAVSVPWRIVTARGIALTDADDGQKFGLPAPVDAELTANELMQGRRVISFDVEIRTADVRIALEGDVALQLFNNSSGYEGWQATFADDGKTITAIGLGGGDINFF